MFVRWKTKPRAGPWHDAEQPYSLLYTAYLVESKRIGGQPRQRSTYLASIQDINLEDILEQHAFWQRLEQRLQILNLPPQLRQFVEEHLQARVPRPSEAVYQQELLRRQPWHL